MAFFDITAAGETIMQPLSLAIPHAIYSCYYNESRIHAKDYLWQACA
jgi:hypothetical protein